MQTRGKIVVVLAVLLFTCVHISAFDFRSLKDNYQRGENLFNELLAAKGKFSRGNGCDITYETKGALMGLEWKYTCVCTDKCTGIREVEIKLAQDNSVEYCLRSLFNRLSNRGEL